MPSADTVKAREHHGASSLDLTVPVEVKRQHEVRAGDVFLVESEEEDGELSITYTRVFKQPD